MRYFLLILFSLWSLAVLAEKKKPVMDSSKVELRAIKMDEYKKDKQFQYNITAEPAPSLWDRFWSWFWKKWNDLNHTKGGHLTLNIIYISLGALAIAFFIWKVIGMNRSGMFGRKDTGTIDYTEGEEDIHSIDFNIAVNEAMEKGNLRLATRLLYLQALKSLADRSLIQWQINKTNTTYVKELQQHPLQKAFARLTYIFEYTWYGSMMMNRQQFADVYETFKQFQQQL